MRSPESRKILAVQRGLSRLGYDPGPPDGIFGELARSALFIFQRDHGLLTDGVPGPQTRAALAGTLRRNRVMPASPLVSTLLRRIVIKKGHLWNEDDGRINLVGVRGFFRGHRVENRLDFYNDTLFAIINNNNLMRVAAFEATVDPGALTDPNPQGTAHLTDGHHRFRLGLRHGREDALVQAEPMRVLRFFDNKPGKQAPVPDMGWFGIQIHRGGKGRRVGNWSAGCQVVRGEGWPRFLEIVRSAAGRGQVLFGYTLIEGGDLEKALIRTDTETTGNFNRAQPGNTAIATKRQPSRANSA